VTLGEQFPMFWKGVAPSSWELSSHLGMLDSRTTANHSPSDAEPFPEDLNVQNAVKGHHQSWNTANLILFLLCPVLQLFIHANICTQYKLSTNMSPPACFSNKSPFLERWFITEFYCVYLSVSINDRNTTDECGITKFSAEQVLLKLTCTWPKGKEEKCSKEWRGVVEVGGG